MLKETIKNLKLFIILLYRLQMRFKLLKKSDKIEKVYKKEIKEYWKKFNLKPRLYWHKFYTSRNGIKDVRYIPEDYFFAYIVPYYNKLDLSKAYVDKAQYSRLFPDVKRPNTIAKNVNGFFYDDFFNPIEIEDVLNKCENYSRIIVKPTIESGAGKNIVFINEDDKDEMRKKVEEAIQKFKKNFIIQEILRQHEVLNNLNPSSVNTIRVVSFVHKNEVHILSTHIRIGTNNSKYDHYGIFCGIEDDGVLQDRAYVYKLGEIVYEHPQGYNFKGVRIPNFEALKETVKRIHKRIGYFRLISWDFAIDENGEPVLIEMNIRWQGLNHNQLTLGPLFGSLTDEVINEVFNGVK